MWFRWWYGKAASCMDTFLYRVMAIVTPGKDRKMQWQLKYFTEIILKTAFHTVENIAFSPFPTMFSKGFSHRVIKTLQIESI